MDLNYLIGPTFPLTAKKSANLRKICGKFAVKIQVHKKSLGVFGNFFQFVKIFAIFLAKSSTNC